MLYMLYMNSKSIIKPDRASLQEGEAALHEEDDDGHDYQEKLIRLLSDLSSPPLGLIESPLDVLYQLLHGVRRTRECWDTTGLSGQNYLPPNCYKLDCNVLSLNLPARVNTEFFFISLFIYFLHPQPSQKFLLKITYSI